MRAKMRRASSMALLMTERPGAVNTSAAAPRAASVAPETAVPQSACFRAGASLTPSPVMATRWPRACSALTIAYLCSGKTRAKPSARSMASAMAGGTLLGSMSLGKHVCGRDDMRAHAELARGFDGNGGIAGHHFDPHALLIGEFDRLFGIVARRIEHRQYA